MKLEPELLQVVGKAVFIFDQEAVINKDHLFFFPLAVLLHSIPCLSHSFCFLNYIFIHLTVMK